VRAIRDAFPGGLLAATLLLATCGGGDEVGEAAVRPDGPVTDGRAAEISPGTPPLITKISPVRLEV
jgi:hypothetical protein